MEEERKKVMMIRTVSEGREAEKTKRLMGKVNREERSGREWRGWWRNRREKVMDYRYV